MNDPQGPNETVPQDQPGSHAVIPPVISTFFLGPGWSTSVLDFADIDPEPKNRTCLFPVPCQV